MAIKSVTVKDGEITIKAEFSKKGTLSASSGKSYVHAKSDGGAYVTDIMIDGAPLKVNLSAYVSVKDLEAAKEAAKETKKSKK